MSESPNETRSLSDFLEASAGVQTRFLWSSRGELCLGQFLESSCLTCSLVELQGRSVLILTRDQLSAAAAMIELDGIVCRLIVCPSSLSLDEVKLVLQRGAVDIIITDDIEFTSGLAVASQVVVRNAFVRPREGHGNRCSTEWVLLTSGTTRDAKLVAHDLSSLTSPILLKPLDTAGIVWGTFYDIRRYGGLQIFLRAVCGTGSLVLSDENEHVNDHLSRLASRGVTHLTGTPSHWRRALMSPASRMIRPRYARLSGEIADQAILNALHAAYPEAGISHAFASTEAGVAFEVSDRLEGFPVSIIGNAGAADVILKDQCLRIRSGATASRYLGEETELRANDGFVDTGDMVEQRGNRCYFLGRKTGVINIGGQKVFPEEVEAQINRHPAVRMSCVRPQPNPITGALVIADVVLQHNSIDEASDENALKQEILKLCRNALPRHKVPARLNFVSSLAVSANGKLVRDHA